MHRGKHCRGRSDEADTPTRWEEWNGRWIWFHRSEDRPLTEYFSQFGWVIEDENNYGLFIKPESDSEWVNWRDLVPSHTLN